MRDLSKLLRPNSIAIIGGRSEARYVTENCAKVGFAGPVWHVHPKRGQFSSLSDLPSAPDAAFVCVNRSATVDVVRDLAQMAAGGAVAYAAGFAEAARELDDGVALQDRLLAAAGDMPVIGPNCYGFLNYLDGAALWPDQQGGTRCQSGVALLTQSSNIAINLTMQRRGLPIAYVMTAGNQAQQSLADLARAALTDPRVTALGLHIEGVGDIRAFEAMAADAYSLGKPVVAIKAGRSEQAQAATISHTASLAGSAAGASAFFKRLGIAEVSSLTALIETLKLVHVHGPLGSNRIAAMSCSGGEAGLMADAAMARGLTYPKLTEAQIKPLGAALGSKVSLANPLDYNTYIWNDGPAMAATYTAMMQADLGLGVVVADFPRADRCFAGDWEPVIQGVAEAQATTGRKMAILASLPENLAEDTATRLIGMGIAPLQGIEDAVTAMEAAAWLGQARPGATPILLPVEGRQAVTLTEAEGKAALEPYGLDVPVAQLCDLNGIAAAVRLVPPPFVLKGQGLAHKTEAGAVALNLKDARQALDAAHKMPVRSFLIEEMITGGVAELLIGVTADPAHGFVLTLAAGGTLTELLQDRASVLLPATEEDVLAALHRLRIAPLLDGYRGAPAGNRPAILAAVQALQDYVEAHPGISEIEVNPLIVTPDRAVAADILIKGTL